MKAEGWKDLWDHELILLSFPRWKLKDSGLKKREIWVLTSWFMHIILFNQLYAVCIITSILQMEETGTQEV